MTVRVAAARAVVLAAAAFVVAGAAGGARATPTDTATSTLTVTESVTATATETPAGPTDTHTISLTPTITMTPTISGTYTITPTATLTPQFFLVRPMQNVFNPNTGPLLIEFYTANISRVRVRIFNGAGEYIRQLWDDMARLDVNGRFFEGVVFWDGRNYLDKPVASGVYFIRMDARGYTARNWVNVALIR